ncbi:MAG: hypothetical protein ACLFVS_04595 [Candidatus Acetothermia bacterium]
MLFSSSAALAADESTGGEPAGANGTFPRFGVGAQFIFPSGGISTRLRLNSSLGLEANAVLWSSPSFGIDGTASLRLLSYLTENDLVNFYLATGGAYNFDGVNPASLGHFTAVATGGIALNVLSERFRVNLEFGLQGRAINDFGMTFGSGFHYYF